MPKICQVCSTEPAKYTCPACRVMSCSLGCTQSHKIYCTPKPTTTASDQGRSQAPAESGPAQGAANSHVSEETKSGNKEPFSLESLGSSKELQDLFTRYPGLRGKLREIYRSTLEEEWASTQEPGRGRGHDRRRGHHRGGGNRGQWTAEKGFNSGLGKVRKWRESCEDGRSTGPDAEGFMRFFALVNDEHEGPS
ncbi:hypothetical protein VTN77DRAFT_4270 [Rasamsonia byssochlamydoides]|uniref:uncharacterized protein n=1 Tax=Rasamsonia byssochlamydoides TaxID=89139 RepID=UPI003742626C